MPKTAADEVRMVCCLESLCFCDLRTRVSLLAACSDNTLSGFASANKSLSSVGERAALEHWKPWQASSETVILLSLFDGNGGAWELSGAQTAVRVSCEMCPVASMVCKANSSATRIRSFSCSFHA